MTEQDWLPESRWVGDEHLEPRTMLRLLEKGRASDRKLRLFATACAREVWDLYPETDRLVLAVAEEYAAGIAVESERVAVLLSLVERAGGRPMPTPEEPQHLSLDKGYDYDAVRATVAAYGYTAHIRTRGEEATAKREIPGYRARRWIIERTHSWMNRFRRLLIRWEKKVDHYVAFLHFACAWIAFRAAGVVAPLAQRAA